MPMERNNDKLRIAMLGHKRIPSREGGVEIVVEQLSTRMAAQNHQVTCFNRSGNHIGGKEFQTQQTRNYNGVTIRPVLTIDKKGLAAMTSSFFGAARAAVGKYDVVHFHAEGPCAMLWLPKLFGKKCVATVHGLDWQRDKWKGGFGAKYIKFGERVAVEFADEIIVLSRQMQTYFDHTYGRHTTFISNGVTRPEKVEARQIQEQFGLQKDGYILFLGRIVPEKGLENLIKAYKAVDTEKKLVIAGSAEYMGAAILCTGAALRSGCGLVTARIPAEGRTAMLVSHPSAIISADEAPVFSSLPAGPGKYSSVAAGPGLGRSEAAAGALRKLLASLPEHSGIRTLVLDADALNIISEHPDMLDAIPGGSVLTPHLGELKRLMRAAAVGGLLEDAGPAGADSPWHDDMHRIALVRQLAGRLKSVIVVKGAHTMTCSPDGRGFFNMRGNPGMAKGGSGDVLTGLIAGLASRGYDPLTAAVLGVWFHGRAGDDAAASRGVESMNAADILENIRIRI